MAERMGEARGDVGAAVSEPESTEEARRAIERTRGRISSTLDAIEDRLDQKKEALKERADVLRPVRHQIRAHRWPSLGFAFGTGLLLSAIGGDRHRPERRARPDRAEREELRRWRAERRARLEARAEEQERGRRAPMRRPKRKSPFAELGRSVLRGVTEGLRERTTRAA